MRFLVVALVGATLAQCRQPPRASTDCGPMFGSWDEEFPSIASFRGIPYGAPPVGRAGRWKPPQKASCWEGDLNATTEGNKCYQFFGPFGDLSLDPGDQKESEDCLNLDVFTNNLDGNRKLPVFVWIYGGSLVMGSTLDYGPIQRMVQLGDVVLVAMNYRINSLGFFTHPLLDAEDPRGVSGNYGLLDQQLALAFVQKNIHRFGGDASRVTVIGQSSGGTSIFGLLASPGSLGLFSGAISLSGSPNITISRTAAQVLQSPLVDATNCSGSSDVLACMYALSPKQIEKSTPNSWLPESFFPTHPGGNGFVPMPIVDGVTIPRPLLEALSSGLIDVPTIIQSARDEDDGFANAKMLNLTANEFKTFLQDHFAAWANETGDKLYQAYAQQAAQADGHGYYDLDADIGMTCAGPALATAAGKGFKSPVYVSVVMQPPSSPVPSEPTLPFATMPFHGWDFATGFGIWKKGFSPASADYAVGEVMRAQWLALAYNATLEDSPHAFPSYHQGAVTGLQYAQGVTAVSHYKRDVCEMLVDLGLGQGYWWIN